MEELLALLIAFTGLVVGSVTDIQKREVADWVNYGLMISGIGLALIASVITWDFSPLLDSIFGILFMFLLGVLMFYTGQWGGGDSKMLMGLGALIGIPFIWPITDTFKVWGADYPFIFVFLLFSLLAGAIYGVIWSLVLVIIRWKAFYKELKKRLKVKYIMIFKYICLAFLILMLILGFTINDYILKVLFITMGVMVPLMFYMWIFIKIIEKVCMIKDLTPKQLTEGDWIAEDVKLNGKLITGPKDLGISKENIEVLKKAYAKGKIKTVKVKEGIPFVPSFLLAFIGTLFFFKYFY